MMRSACALFLFLWSINLYGEKMPVRQVPSSIEIAELKLKITPEAQREIQKDINALRASEKYFNIKLDRANLYFPLIEKILKEEGVPDDIKYLALQESALISDQVSSSDAVGYWQFKDFTAREVGMRVDSKVDERKNIIASTHGAAKYMRKNNFMLKNWIYTVNAYMTGLGGVKAHIDEANIGSSSLKITNKTHWYVKRFIAHVIAFKEDVGRPHSGGMELMVYQKGSNKNLNEIAKKLEVDQDLVNHYNKWLSYGKIPDDRIYSVIIPVSGKRSKIPEQQFVAKNQKENYVSPSYPEEIVERIYALNSTILLEINDRKTILATNNDDLKSLASKSGTSVEKLRKYNDLELGSQIETGQFYFTQSKKASSGIRYHVAQFDQTLWDVSQRYGIKIKKLRNKNRMTEDEKLEPGRVLWLKQKRPGGLPPDYRKIPMPIRKKPIPPKPEARPTTTNAVFTQQPTATDKSTISLKTESQSKRSDIDVHEVEAGESLYAIAKRYDITVEDLKEWNSLRKNDLINAGQKLLVAAPLEVSIEEEDQVLKPLKGEKIHVVSPDETYYSISKTYGLNINEILQRNRLDVDIPIKPNQELIIPIITSKTKTTQKPHSSNTYTVQAGDTFYKIAKEFEISVEDLMKINGKEQPDLSIGEVLKIKD